MPTKTLYIQEYKQIEGEKRWKKICHASNNKSRAEVALSISEKIDFKTQTNEIKENKHRGYLVNLLLENSTL